VVARAGAQSRDGRPAAGRRSTDRRATLVQPVTREDQRNANLADLTGSGRLDALAGNGDAGRDRGTSHDRGPDYVAGDRFTDGERSFSRKCSVSAERRLSVELAFPLVHPQNGERHNLSVGRRRLEWHLLQLGLTWGSGAILA
jgi:hypothetical protein